MGYVTMYIGVGVFEHLRKVMNREFKRVGITKMKDKYGYFMQVLNEAPTIKELSVSQMEKVIQSLRELTDSHFGHLIEETLKEQKGPSEFSLFVKQKRKSLGWSTRMFENMTGISQYRLSRIGTGTIEATEQEKCRINSAFDKWEEQKELY